MTAMDHAAYHVVYVDSRLSQGLDGQRLQRPAQTSPSSSTRNTDQCDPDSFKAIIGEIEEVRSNLERLLTQFNRVYTCTCEKTCMAHLRRLDSAGPVPNPTIVLSGTTFDHKSVPTQNDDADLQRSTGTRNDSEGLALLQNLTYEMVKANLSSLVIPVAMIHFPIKDTVSQQPFTRNNQSRPASGGLSSSGRKGSNATATPTQPLWTHQHTLRCIDAGAVDVLESPLEDGRIRSLITRAYRTHKEALHARELALEKKRSRKLSWLGNTENKPYAYLREKMVSDLMTGICNPDEHFHLGNAKPLPPLEPSREALMHRTLASWSYWGQEFTEDELIHAAKFMLQHALAHPALEKWRVSPEKLVSFLMASRAAYNDFVEYHNFRHVIDVMQATFHFLIRLRVLPEYGASTSSPNNVEEGSPLASLLRPVDALTMLITAIGHDVGHPGVNNAFLVALNAPLAQLYNDKSVLEAFHCAAFSQILRRYWPVAFQDAEMRSLMINSILATDMGVHQKYMMDLGNLQDKWHHESTLDIFNAQQLDEFRILICALLIKCADISNVARPYDVAVRWANILQDEFANQGVMEREVGIPTTLFGGPPELGNLVKLGNSQKSFMNFFAQPLFESVASILPPMDFAVNELQRNQEVWAKRIQAENERLSSTHGERPSVGTLSPRTRSTERHSSQPELSLSEGLPASDSSSDALQSLSLSQSNLMSQDQIYSRKSLSASPQATSEPSLPSGSTNGPSRGGHAQKSTSAGYEGTTNTSRRSSGAFPSAGNSKLVPAQRRTSNSSPSQLQLALDSRRGSNSAVTNSENRAPNDRASEDTLSQMAFLNGVAAAEGTHGANAGLDEAPTARGGNLEKDPSNATSSVRRTVDADGPYKNLSHNRSSSGAHTNTTSASISLPYSPTDTQATSVVTTDSDTKSSHARVDNLAERNQPKPSFVPAPFIKQSGVGLPSSDHSLGHRQAAITATIGQSGTRTASNCGTRSVGRKTSKFNIFSSWREKRRHRPESGS